MAGQPSDDKWHFWIDRGGTFTDVVARAPDGPHPRPQAAVGEPRRLRRRGAGGDPAIPGRGDAGRRSRRSASPRSRWGRRSRPTRCWSARATRRCWSSRAGSPTSSRSARRRGRTFSPSASSSRRCCIAASIEADERVRADGTVETPLDLARAGGGAAGGARGRHRRGGDRVHARLCAIPSTSGRRPSSRASSASRRCRRATRCRR